MMSHTTKPKEACFPRKAAGLLCLIIIATGRLAVAQEPFHGPGVVLLKDDRFQAGFVHQSAKSVKIELDPQSSVTHLPSEVAFVGKDLESVYHYKVRKYSRLGVGEHFQLTRWCMGAGLLDYAAEHFAQVSKTRPDEPRVRQLGLELREKMLQDTAFRQYLGLMPLNESTPVPGLDASPVRSASFERMAAEHPLVMTQFSQEVQPILINRCSQSACHGFSSNNRLKLLEPKGKAFSRITSENLKSVLQFLASDNATASELLHKATTAHSLQKRPALGAEDAELVRRLDDWMAFARNPVVNAVASRIQDGPATGLASSTTPATSPALIPVQPGSAKLREVPQNGRQDFSRIQGFDPPKASEIDRLDAELRRILGEPPLAAQSIQNPADPFDPAIFNQQFGRAPATQPNR